MPESAEQRVDTHRLVRERVAAGKPVWQHHVRLGHVFHADDLTFEQRRDQIQTSFQLSSWLKSSEEFDPIHELVEELGETRDESEFNVVFDAIYDEANYARAWIDTLST